ncbi:MAG: hypothetical protein EP308_05065, partial [Burkholderiales bacterium]
CASGWAPSLMRSWLGPKPVDWQLKDALLGKTSS